MLFSELPIRPKLKSAIAGMGFESLTEIQAQAIPTLLAGKDLIGQSKTGSGKTLAFSIPLLEKLQSAKQHPQALVILPTRELAVQVAREMRRLGRDMPGFQVTILTGGQSFRDQKFALSRGTHVVIGTPGRILDHLTRGTLFLPEVSTLILDEADRMLEMGFQEDLTKILEQIPVKRQTVLFSATFPKTIEKLSEGIQSNPDRIVVQSPVEENKSIDETLIRATGNSASELAAVITALNPGTAIVFCNLKATVKSVTDSLKKAGFSAEMLSGDLEQSDRDRVMAKFRNQSLRVLVATDVAARGIDVDALDLVVNFELPREKEIYTHRIGRTGRAGKNGIALSWVTHPQHAIVRKLSARGDVKKFDSAAEYLETLQLPAKKGDATAAAAAMKTLYISGGRKHKLRPGDILGALTGDAGKFSGEDIGKIEIHDFFSYVAVKAEIANLALKRLREGRIKSRRFNVELVR